MYVSLAIVTSADGKSTKGNTVQQSAWSWASGDDREFFMQLRDSQDAIVLGRRTYEAQKPFLKIGPSLLRVVMTSRPDDFLQDSVPGQLEFTSESPQALLDRLEQAGYEKVMLVCGGKLTGVFMDTGLVSDIYQTIEPRLFGEGNGIADGVMPTQLRLVDVRALGEHGTLMLHYKVLDNAPVPA